MGPEDAGWQEKGILAEAAARRIRGGWSRPRTGKFLKKDLRKPYWEGRERQVV